MKLRTPRRRVAPQAKLRYRAIRGFLRRTLGTQSQATMQVKSSGSSNGTGVQNKVLRLRDHSKTVSYCSDLLDSREITSRSINQSAQDNKTNQKLTNRSDHCRRAISGTETEVLYQTTAKQFQKTYCSDSHHSVDGTSLDILEIPLLKQRVRPKKKKKEKTENISPRFGSDYNRLHCYIHKTNNQRTDDRAPSVTYHHQNLTSRKRLRRFKNKNQYAEVETYHRKPHYNKRNERLKIHKSDSQGRCYQVTPRQNRKTKSFVDQDFIADIIQRQYKPVKRFVTKESAISQFTVPECKEMAPACCSFGAMNDIACPCTQRLCHDRKHCGYYTGHGDRCNMRSISELGSICDTRLYSNRQRTHPKKPRRTENYNDSTLYDVIPVKERSSPKIRRRQPEYDLTDDSQYYVDDCRRAVPPSPRSQRPRLNLRSQCYQECEHYSPRENTNRKSSSKLQRRKPNPDVLKTFNGWETQECENCTKRLLNGYRIIGGENQIPETDYVNHVYSNEFSDLNNSQDNKTVNALSEIKDLLKNFLDELKKDLSGPLSVQSTSNGIHAQTSKKSEMTNRIEDTTIETNINFSKLHPIDQSYVTNNNPLCFNNEQCLHTSPYLSTKANYICCPLHPTYPLNSTANMCNLGLQTSAQHQKFDGANYKSSEGPNETDILLKEIHKFVTQDHNVKRKESLCQLRETRTAEVALMTAKSVCGSHVSRRDARVGTPMLKCCSRSCEAIGSPRMNNTQKAYSTYFDTDFEGGLESNDLDPDVRKPLETNVQYKCNKSKLSMVLRSLFKKKKSKTEDIEEMDESELINNRISPRDMRHIQPGEFPPAKYQRYPIYQTHPPPPVRHKYQERHSHHSSGLNRPGHHQQQKEYRHPYAHHQYTHEPQGSRPRPSAPPYHPEHHQNPNLCVQEVEVTSASIQSENMFSFFKKLTKKLPQAKPSDDDIYPSNSTERQKIKKPGLFTSVPQRASDIALFTHAEHKKMVLGDTKLRDACLERMLKKKNPFSSKNLLLKTLMGKDTKPKFDPMKIMRSKLLM